MQSQWRPPERHLSDYGGILQADVYAGFNALYKGDRAHGPITEAACWAHARRKFFVLADIATKAKSKKPMIVSPIALKAVKWFDAIFEWEGTIRNLVCGAIVTPMEGDYGYQEGHIGRASFGP
jgi:transposase